jgi:tetratricopeptide (TPR) repeat protein
MQEPLIAQLRSLDTGEYATYVLYLELALLHCVLHKTQAKCSIELTPRPLQPPAAGDLPAAEKQRLAYILARAHDANIDFSQEAEEAWSRAMKLDPSNAEVWRGLGTCVWKRADLRGARDCIERSLQLKPTAKALRDLSQILRQTKGTGAAGQTLIRESTEKAKAAVAMDPSDAANWTCLGTAYLCQYITDNECWDGLDKSSKALTRAATLEAQAVSSSSDAASAIRDPDLHYNRAQVLAFLEEYDGAVREFRISGGIDPSLPFKVRGSFKHVSQRR